MPRFLCGTSRSLGARASRPHGRHGSNGQAVTVTLHPNGVREKRTYTGRDWLASHTMRRADGVVMDALQYFYTDAGGNYDTTGRLRREVDGGGRTHAYFYNNLYELTSETHPDFGTISYGCDLNGNRTICTLNGVTDYYGVGANNKLLWVNWGTNAAPTSGQANPYTLFGYNQNGRVISRERRHDGGMLRAYSLEWDGNNRLRAALSDSTGNSFPAALRDDAFGSCGADGRHR